MTNRELLFVYGTLLRSVNHPIHRVLARHADFVGPASFQGKLYDLGNYPGAAASRNKSDQVDGELYALHDSARTFHELDTYEGNDFRRARVSISCNGETVRSWIYLLDRVTNGLRLIPSGDYATYRKL